jgi:acetyl-CoA acyltransferase
MLQRRTFIVGGHITKFIGSRHPDFIWKKHPDFGVKENPSVEDYIQEAVSGALRETGCTGEQVEKAWIGNFAGELFSKQGHLGAAVVGCDPGLMNKPVMRVEGACASGGLAFSCAVESVQAGTDITLVAGAEVQTTASAREGGAFLARAAHFSRQSHIDDFLFPALFARRIKACKEAFGVTDEDLGALTAKAYGNANLNPLAHMQAVKMDLATASVASKANPNFLGNEELHPYLRLSDCSQVSDGGAAMIVVSEEGLRKLGKTEADCVEVLSVGHSTGNLWEDSDPLELGTTASAAQKAYAGAGVSASDIGVAEVHDCFTITEALMCEALGFAPRGEGVNLIRDGTLHIDGALPVNTGGGLVGFGHPVGATGVKQVLEVMNQMKGKCGDYQMKSQPAFGATANMGGDDKTAVVSVLKNL